MAIGSGSGKQKGWEGRIMIAGSSESPYKHLYYPLNVYAMALQLEEGRVDYLHYGLGRCIAGLDGTDSGHTVTGTLDEGTAVCGRGQALRQGRHEHHLH